MKPAVKPFIIAELILIASLGLITAIVFRTVDSLHYTAHLWFIPAFLFITSTSLFSVHIAKVTDRDSRFTSRYMLSNGVKMMIYLVALVIYAFVFPNNAQAFLIVFLFFYFGFTILEVVFVLRYIKR